MAYDEQLAARIRRLLIHSGPVTEKQMFGGLCFLINGNMCCGVHDQDLVIRHRPDDASALLTQPHVRSMDFTGKPLRGFLYVGSGATRAEKVLQEWVKISVEFARSLPPKNSKVKKT